MSSICNPPKPKGLAFADYELYQTLGKGAFGCVKLAKSKKSGEIVAIKIVKKSQLIKDQHVDHMFCECTILGMVNHPWVVNFFGISQNCCHIHLMMEYVSGGELFDHLRSAKRFTTPEARFYTAQIAMVFEYLQSRNVIYRDLKPENILLASNGYIKLTDFGFAKVCPDKTYTFCGTTGYLAPEILLNQGHGKPVDWWTLGILLYEMLVGRDPFYDEDPMKSYSKITEGKIKFYKGMDASAKSLIRHLLQKDLSKRYGNLISGAKDITGHRFFEEMDWAKLVKMETPAFYLPPQRPAISGTATPEAEPRASVIKIENDPFACWSS